MSLDPAAISFQDLVRQQTKQIVSTASSVISQAKAIAAASPDPVHQNDVIVSAKSTALAASHLISCTKTLLPVLTASLCRAQLLDLTQVLATAVSHLVSSCQEVAIGPEQFTALGVEANKISKELSVLFQQLQSVEPVESRTLDNDIDTIFRSMEDLEASVGNSNEMLRLAKIIIVSATAVLESIQQPSNMQQSTMPHDLLQHCTHLSSALSVTIDVAKAVAGRPRDMDAQIGLAGCIPNLKAALVGASRSMSSTDITSQLSASSLRLCSDAIELTSFARSVDVSSLSLLLKEQILNQCALADEALPQLLASARSYHTNHESTIARMELVSYAKVRYCPYISLSVALLATISHSSRISVYSADDREALLNHSTGHGEHVLFIWSDTAVIVDPRYRASARAPEENSQPHRNSKWSC